MFTGLVETKGTLVRRSQHGKDARLVIRGELVTSAAERSPSSPSSASSASSLRSLGPEEPPRSLVELVEPIVLGESIAVDGVCLTVAAIVEPGGPGATV